MIRTHHLHSDRPSFGAADLLSALVGFRSYAEHVLIDAVKVIHLRLGAMAINAHQAILEARQAGTSEMDAFLADVRANALERARLSSLLPCLPDDLEKLRRRIDGLPPVEMCPITDAPAH